MLVGIVTLIISAIVVFNHQLVWLLAVFPGLYIAYAFFIAFSKAPKLKDSIHLTHAEKEAWREHHAFFRFPFAARNMAGALSMLQFISIILAIALAVTGASWGLAFALGWFILGLPTPRLNPTTTYVPAAQKGDARAVTRVGALESLQGKLSGETPTVNNSDTDDKDKNRGLSPEYIEELNQIKEQRTHSSEAIIVLFSRVPPMEIKMLKLRHDVPEHKDAFFGVLSYTSKGLFFTHSDYKSENGNLTTFLMGTDEVEDVWMNDERTHIVITKRDGNKYGFITLVDGDSFKGLAYEMMNGTPRVSHNKG